MAFLGEWLVTFVATICAVNLVPGIVSVGGWVGPLACALVLSLINMSIKPILQAIGLPLSVLTLGLFYLIVNALLLELSSWLSFTVLGVGSFIQSFWSAFLGAIIISLVSTIISAITGLGK